MSHRTAVSIEGSSVCINGRPTYEGRSWNGHRIEGLLMNARLVQATFDDENPDTRSMWNTPDGRPFDADVNTDAFIAMLPEWRAHGLLSFTFNLQGGSPQGYSKQQPWHNNAFTPQGELKHAYMTRAARVLDAADALGMAPILGYFYFGQAPHFADEAAVLRATDAVTDWLLDRGDRHVLIEIANEADHVGYPSVIHPMRGGELIERVRERSGGRLLVSTSLMGGRVPNEAIVRSADYLLVHGNGCHTPSALREVIRQTRQVPGYRGQPLICNEDDHFQFDQPDNNLTAAVAEYCGWGYFDFRMKDEGYHEGYQSLPVDWRINSARKRGFARQLVEITGAKGST